MLRKFLCTSLILLIGISSFGQEAWGLRKCIEYAIDNNVDIHSQRLQNQINDQNSRQAKLNIYPNLNGGVSHGYNWGQRIDPFTNSFASERVRNNNLNLNSSVTLYGGSRLQKLKERAQLEIEAGNYDLTKASNDISILIAQSFLSNLLSQEQLKIAEGQRQITVEQIDRMSKLVESGTEPKASLYELEAQLSQDDLSIVRIENDILLSRTDLVNLLQLKKEDAANFAILAPDNLDAQVVMPAISAADLYRSAIDKLPEAQAATLREEQSAIDVEVAKSSGLPTITLFGSVGSGYSGANQEGVGEAISSFVPLGQVGIGGQTVFSLQEQTFYNDFQTRSMGDQLDQNFNQSLGLNLSIPIFNNYSTKIDVQRARIGMEQAQLNSERINNRLSAETQQAYANAIAALNQYKAAEKSSDVLTRNFDIAKKRFEGGLINSIEFNTAKTQMQNQQFQMVSSKYEYIFRMKIMDLYQGKPINL